MHPVNFAFALITIVLRKVVENFITEPPPSDINFLNYTPTCAAAISGILIVLYRTLKKQQSFKIRLSPSRRIYKILAPKKLESRSTICHLHGGRSTSSWGSNNNWRLRDAFLRDTQNSLKSSSSSLSWRSCGIDSNFDQHVPELPDSITTPRTGGQVTPSVISVASTAPTRKFEHYQPYGDCNFRDIKRLNNNSRTRSRNRKQKITRKTRSGRTYSYLV